MPLISGHRLVLAASLMLLAGCSGGGKKSPPSPPPPPPPVAQTIAFADAGPIAKTFGDAPFTNAASGGAGTGAITYSSGSTSVATIDAAGQVTILTAGSAVITANKAADAGSSRGDRELHTKHRARRADDYVRLAWAHQQASR